MNIDEVFRKLRPVMGPQLDALWQEYLVSDESIRHTIESVLRILIAQRLNETFDSEHVLLKPPPLEAAAGPYAVGTIHYGDKGFGPFGLREDEFIQHIGIFGRSGSGKTNLAYLLLRGLARAGKPFLVFDWKRNYRDIVSLPDFNDLIIFTVGRDVTPFRFNPLIPPPGTLPTVWLKKPTTSCCARNRRSPARRPSPTCCCARSASSASPSSASTSTPASSPSPRSATPTPPSRSTSSTAATSP